MTMIERSGAQAAAPRIATAPARDNDPAPAARPRFDDLLRGLVEPCSGAPGFLGQDGDAAPVASAASQQADVFNAGGFFQGRVENETLAPALPAQTLDAVPEPPLPATVHAVAGVPGPLPTPPDNTVRTRLAVAGDLANQADTASPVPHRAGSSPRLNAAPLVITRTAGAPQRVLEAEDAATSTARPARTARFARVLDAGNRNAVQVSLHATDHGATVAAHVGQLDREARVKLRDRIVALLSRHSLTPHSVRVEGHARRPEPLDKER